ncbi:MAG TPA: phenylacetate--CoA ligase family protein [Propionibacteriaceae bacterium]
MTGPSSSLAEISDVWRAPSHPVHQVERQRERLTGLVSYARQHSPYYRALCEALPDDSCDLRQLPIVSKKQLMAHFDQWTTDPAITRTGIDAFVADPSLIGHDFLQRYAVWTTSGTTGTPGIFVHDRAALRVYRLLVALRFYRFWVTPRLLWRTLRLGWRMAAVFAMGGHFGSVDLLARIRRAPLLKDRIQAFSITDPLSELVGALNAFRPAVLASYSSGLSVLAEEQSRGALRITPTLVTGAGEPLDSVARSRLMEAFNAQVYMNYGATEAPYMAFDCPRGRLHLNVDWYIVEPVDRDFEPVPPDQPSHTVLITNLANRVQPIIRYNLGDSITAISEPCSCGNGLPVIEVIGRTNDVLTFHTSGDQTIRLLPLALGTVIEETPGVHRFQAIQTEATTITVRLQVTSGTDQAQVWTALTQRLTAYLSAQGVPAIRIERDPEPPHADPVSGKYRQVWSEV